MTAATSVENEQVIARREALSILCRASAGELEKTIAEIGDQGATLVRGPEIGLVMLRGRIGGDGAPFNVGEVTVTRASVRIASGEVGHSYSLGRDHDRARLAATVDAIWQRDDLRPAVESQILRSVRARLDAEEDKRRRKVAATRVDFFTLVRGDD